MTGAVRVLDAPGGAVYLKDGQIDHVECPVLSGVDRLLTASGRLPSETWRAALIAGRTQCRVGDELIATGMLTAAELKAVVLLALYDAALMLFDAALAVQFEPAVRHPMGTQCALDLAVVCREVDRRKRVLADAYPDAEIDTAAVLPVRRLPDQFVALTALQWEVVANADRRRSPVDLARLLGRDAFTIMLEVRRLARAGLVEAGRATPSAAAESVATVRARAAVPVMATRARKPQAPHDQQHRDEQHRDEQRRDEPPRELPRRPVPTDLPPQSTGFEYCSEEVLVRLRTGLAAMR